MGFDFKGRKVIVLGSSSGIGFEVARQLAIGGANVCLAGSDLKKLEKAYEVVNRGSFAEGKNIYCSVDLTRKDAIDCLWAEVLDKWQGKVDSLVLNSGGPPLVKNITEVGEENWLKYFQSLFLSQINLVAKCLDYMKDKQFGRIVSISSSSIIEPIQGLVISNTIRPALAGYLKTLANEVAAYGINVTNAIIGKIDTDRIKSLDQSKSEGLKVSLDEIIKNNQKAIPAGRYGSPKEAADVIMFLLSEYASYVSGSSVYIDGGAVKKYI